MRTFKFLVVACVGMMLAALQFSASAEISHKSGDAATHHHRLAIFNGYAVLSAALPPKN